MTNELLTLQMTYADALFQIEHYQRVAEMAKAKLDAIATSQAADKFEENPSNIEAPCRTELSPETIKAEFEQDSNLRGIRAAVARRLGLTDTHVAAVARGERTSERVMAALVEERQRRAKERVA